MSEMSLQEAQLFRMLGGFFGRDRVVWNMSVRTVCGGAYPPGADDIADDIGRWAEVSGCLFTIIDDDDSPKMVIEFAVDLTRCIDLQLLERQERLPKLLKMCGVRYFVVTEAEFEEILDPNSSLDLTSLLKDRLGLAIDDDEDDELGV